MFRMCDAFHSLRLCLVSHFCATYNRLLVCLVLLLAGSHYVGRLGLLPESSYWFKVPPLGHFLFHAWRVLFFWDNASKGNLALIFVVGAFELSLMSLVI